jgi:hypothetical protein
MKRRKILPFCSQRSFPPSVISYLKLFLLVQNSPKYLFFKYSFFFFFNNILVVLYCTWHILPVFIRFSSLFFYYQPLCLDCSLLTEDQSRISLYYRSLSFSTNRTSEILQKGRQCRQCRKLT